MADPTRGRGNIVACDEGCGCPSPCPGGNSCSALSGGGSKMEHKQCSCGQHCGCNPCSCSDSTEQMRGTGKAFCRCGEGCTCPTCAAAS